LEQQREEVNGGFFPAFPFTASLVSRSFVIRHKSCGHFCLPLLVVESHTFVRLMLEH
jgi:hypothetical protein